MDDQGYLRRVRLAQRESWFKVVQISYAVIVVLAAAVLFHVDKVLQTRSEELHQSIIPVIDTYSAIEHIQLPYERLFEIVAYQAENGQGSLGTRLDQGIQTVQAEFFALLNPKSSLAKVITGSETIQEVQQTSNHFDSLAEELEQFAHGKISRDRVLADLAQFREELNWLNGKFYNEQIRNYDSLIASISDSRRTFRIVVIGWFSVAVIFAILVWLGHLVSRQLIRERERTLERKRFFISMFNHEIRNPLQMVAGSIEDLVDSAEEFTTGAHSGDTAARIRLAAQRIDKQFGRIEARVKAFGDFARLESGQVKPQNAHFDLRRLLEEIVTSYQSEVARRKLTLVTTVDDDLSSVLADRLKIEEIIRNLLDNAVKYTNAGEIRVRVSRGTRRNHSIRISVSDTGYGIDQDDLKTIFEPFIRKHESVAPAHGASIGLGLSIVDVLVEILGGSIMVKSELGKGTTFVVEIPISCLPSTTIHNQIE